MMDHAKVKRLLPLLMYDELSKSDATAVQAHLRGCAACRREHDALRRFGVVMNEATRPAIDDASLLQYRRDLIRGLRPGMPTPALGERILAWFGLNGATLRRPALTLMAIAILAFVAGALLFRGVRSGERNFLLTAFDPSSTPAGSATNVDETQVTNLRIVNQNDQTGDIEFEFEAVMPVHVRGNMRDPAIQAVLARALVSSQNPGVRLRAANVIAGDSEDKQWGKGTRHLIKGSLIDAVLHDDNRGVRLEALKALRPFLPDSEATAAILQVLRSETNVGMKIAAINTLDLDKFTGSAVRDQLVTALRERSLSDDNNYIRIRANAALQEVQK